MITEVILTCNEPDGVFNMPIEWINAHIASPQRGLTIVDTSKSGGSKVFAHGIYIACFNHLDREWFIDLVKLAPWENPEGVTVMWSRENPDDAGFVIAYQGED